MFSPRKFNRCRVILPCWFGRGTGIEALSPDRTNKVVRICELTFYCTINMSTVALLFSRFVYSLYTFTLIVMIVFLNRIGLVLFSNFVA
jgi:hypothetical protein